MEERNDIVIYRSEDGLVKMEALVDPSGETIWATQKAIAALFDVTVPNISYHFKKIFQSGELDPDMVIKEILITAQSGVRGRSKYVLPKSNVAFWREKIARNQERDLFNNQRLETLAWHVVTVWECELEKARFAETMERIETEIRAGQAAWEACRERRRWDRVFAREQARLRRFILADVPAELDERYDIPPGVKKMARRESL